MRKTDRLQSRSGSSLLQTQITKVHDTNHDADFHDCVADFRDVADFVANISTCRDGLRWRLLPKPHDFMV